MKCGQHESIISTTINISFAENWWIITFLFLYSSHQWHWYALRNSIEFILTIHFRDGWCLHLSDSALLNKVNEYNCALYYCNIFIENFNIIFVPMYDKINWSKLLFLSNTPLSGFGMNQFARSWKIFWTLLNQHLMNVDNLFFQKFDV